MFKALKFTLIFRSRHTRHPVTVWWCFPWVFTVSFCITMLAIWLFVTLLSYWGQNVTCAGLLKACRHRHRRECLETTDSGDPVTACSQNQRTWHPTETYGTQGTGLCVCSLPTYGILLEGHTWSGFSLTLNHLAAEELAGCKAKVLAEVWEQRIVNAKVCVICQRSLTVSWCFD